MLGPFATASRLTPIHQVSLAVLSRAACVSMSTTTTTTTRDRGDRYGPMEWAQSPCFSPCVASPARKLTGEATGLAEQSMKKPTLVSLILFKHSFNTLMLESPMLFTEGGTSGSNPRSYTTDVKKIASVLRNWRIAFLIFAVLEGVGFQAYTKEKLKPTFLS